MSTVSLAVIQRHVALAFELPPREMTSDRRSRPIVEARHIAMWLAVEMTDTSLVQIGRAFGNRDHTTVMHALEKAQALLNQRQGLPELVERIRAAIEAETAAENDTTKAVLLTNSVVTALRVALIALARRDPAAAIAIILPIAERLADGGKTCG